MTEEEIQQLLYRRESETLDFKRQQYLFIGAPDSEKAELLKDVLAFANAWRSSPAYILVGVEELPEPAAIGIPETEHLNDHDLQQFVNTKTNRPVRLAYERAQFHGLQLGILVIDHPQQRPVYLTRGFGALRANAVYLRRGSSTAEAPPDEVAAMGRAEVEARSEPSIALEFAPELSEDRLGRDIVIEKATFDVRSPREPSDEAEYRGVVSDPEVLFARKDEPRVGSRWGQRADEIVRLAEMHPLRFWLFNSAPVTATDVGVRIEVPGAPGLEVIDRTTHPKHAGPYSYVMPPFGAPRVEHTQDGWRITFRLMKLQPRDEYITWPFYLRATIDLRIELTASIFADNLREPIQMPLTIETRRRLPATSISYAEAGRLWQNLVR